MFTLQQNTTADTKVQDIIVSKGGHNPLSRNPRCPHLLYPIEKTKVLNDSFNQFVYNFYPQSILILEEYLQEW